MIPRTYLFVPGDRPERFDKALASGADAVVLDLEDAVAPERQEPRARAVAGWFADLAAELRPRIAVRVNDAAMPCVRGRRRDARRGRGWVGDAAKDGDRGADRGAAPGGARTGVLALVESARGVSGIDAIAATPGVERLSSERWISRSTSTLLRNPKGSLTRLRASPSRRARPACQRRSPA